MNSNKELVEYLVLLKRLQTPNLIEAFLEVDRKNFVPNDLQPECYGDYPLSIGFSQTISQPSTVAIMLEFLQPRQGNKVLDIGSGSGYTTALLAKAVGDEGHVLGLDRVPELVEYGRKNIAKLQLSNTDIEIADDVLGKPGEKFDRILVSASSQVYPFQLEEQLNNEGRMVIPVGNSIFSVYKNSDGVVETEELYGFVFVPLIFKD